MKTQLGGYCIFGILFAIAGVALYIRWTTLGGELSSSGLLFAFLPAGVFAVAHFASQNTKQGLVHFVAIPCCLLAVAFWGVTILGTEICIAATSEETDTDRYEQILDDYWNINKESLVAHFPRPIPPKAEAVHFSFLPAFLQGGAHIQLRYSLPAIEISDLFDCYSEEATKSFIGGDMNDHMNMPDGMPTTFFYTNDTDDSKFPDDFEIMIFDEVLKKEDRPEGHYWNHGDSHGVAISKTRNIVVYWAESW